ncbi:DUF4252 domain-containing protein [Gaetbulibacter saemankumensis]|uniref:DUF4252 domain-containing protein n=1 Tax=Gaetbulibacter saemankumensis TaxID=311208 RepID=UPI0004187765|nr:DUF4252 domain-containing protein [Gaetbulibacter saemankumensis]
MKRTINQIAGLLIVVLLLVSCEKKPSLQTYFVDHQESPNYISQDLPISMLNIDQTNFTDDQKIAYNSVSRLNFLGYKPSESNSTELEDEIHKVKTILSQSKYNELIEFNDRGSKVTVKYIGDDNEADEFVVFGASKELGFGIVRVLGDDMTPQKMTTLVGLLQKANIDEAQLQDVMSFFK